MNRITNKLINMYEKSKNKLHERELQRYINTNKTTKNKFKQLTGCNNAKDFYNQFK